MNYEIGDIIVNSNTVYLSILSNMEIRMLPLFCGIQILVQRRNISGIG